MREFSVNFDGGYLAGANLPEGAGVIYDTAANEVKLPTADGQQIVGVVLYAVSEGQQVTLRKAGVAKLLTTGAYSAGDDLMVTATTGAFKKATAKVGATVYVAAIAEEANGASDTLGFGTLCIGKIIPDSVHVAASADPGANNDGVDTAAFGKRFAVGAIWVNETDDGIFVCANNGTGAAVWKEVSIVGHTHA